MADRFDFGRRTASLEQSQSLSRGVLILYALAICAVAIGYSFYTDHIWEDSLITLQGRRESGGRQRIVVPRRRASSHVHFADQRVDAGLVLFLTGKTSYVATIWLYRVFSIAAFAGSGVLLLQGAARAAPRWTPAWWWLAIVYVFDIKIGRLFHQWHGNGLLAVVSGLGGLFARAPATGTLACPRFVLGRTDVVSPRRLRLHRRFNAGRISVQRIAAADC